MISEMSHLSLADLRMMILEKRDPGFLAMLFCVNGRERKLIRMCFVALAQICQMFVCSYIKHCLKILLFYTLFGQEQK